MRKGYADIASGQVHFRSAGDSGPVVVLMHQTASSSRMFVPLMERLAGSYRVIAFDTPGFGQSDPHPVQPSIADLARTLQQAAQSLGLAPVHLIGHHTGAAIATEWAAEAPGQVMSLTMVGALAMGNEERARWFGGLKPAEIDPSGGHLQASWERVARIDAEPVLFPPGPELRHREAVDALLAMPRWPEAYRAVFSYDFEGALQRVQCRKLLICGDQDILAPYVPATVECMRDGRFHTLNAGAYVLEQNLDEVAPLIETFLTDSTPSPRRQRNWEQS